ncbi:MAG: ABC transporter ATP-binding protein, partial [Polyangiales bacterium]
MKTAILEARGLTKSYGERLVVDHLDLSCRRGTVLGLLGPNGAGKTTTLRMLYGFVPPDEGAIQYAGKRFSENRAAAKRMIGVCTQDDSLDYDFTVAQNLRIYASYFRPRVEDLQDRVAELLDRFELAPHADASPHVLSGGFVRRLLIARSIVHRPSVLFLDEPTTGLDPSARLDVWELVDALRAEGLAIVLTTHYMDEAERLSDELLVIHEGRKVAYGEPHRVIDSVLG